MRALASIDRFTDLTATAREADAVVTDVSRIHDTAFGPLGDSAGGYLDLRMPAAILVDDLGAVKHGFGSDAVGLWTCQ